MHNTARRGETMNFSAAPPIHTYVRVHTHVPSHIRFLYNVFVGKGGRERPPGLKASAAEAVIGLLFSLPFLLLVPSQEWALGTQECRPLLRIMKGRRGENEAFSGRSSLCLPFGAVWDASLLGWGVSDELLRWVFFLLCFRYSPRHK